MTDARDLDKVLDKIIRPSDKCLMQDLDPPLPSANYKALLGEKKYKRTVCKIPKLEGALGTKLLMQK